MKIVPWLSIVVLLTGAFSVNDTVAQDNHVAVELAETIETAVASAGYSINIAKTESLAVNINKIDGLALCDPAAKEKVQRLQSEFNKQPHLHQNFSVYDLYVKKEDGSITHLAGDTEKAKALKFNCNFLYVSVRKKNP